MKYSIRLITIFIAIQFCSSGCEKNKSIVDIDDQHAMIMALKWQEQHPIFAKAPTDWTNGAYYTGVYRAHLTTGNDTYLQALTDMGKRNEWKPWERYYHADDLAICSSYLYVNSLGVNDVDLLPTKSIITDHLYMPHEWRDGTAKGEKVILWWWCDALFMAPPVLTAYAELTNDTTYLDIMHKYYMETYDLLFDLGEKLFARDLRYVWKGDSTDRKDINGQKIFWSRGNGWVIGGLALMLDKMPQNYKHRTFYEELFKTMAKRLKEIQHEDGLWRTSLLSPESYDHGEVSGSGFFTFAIAWGINNGLLDSTTYTSVVQKSWSALRECQQDNGMVGWVQNIGDSPKPADKNSWQNYGTGAFLLAGSEILILNQ